jgi:molybdenum cofactor guanylyltransferase
MGTDKALLLWQGEPLLLRVCRVCQSCCQQVQVLSPWPERYRSILPKDCLGLQERQPGTGPLVALHQGLTEIDQEWILLLACDLPCLRRDVLHNWAQQLPQMPETVMAVVPRCEGRWEPLCGFYRQAAGNNLEEYLLAGGRSFQGWLSRIHSHPLEIDSALLPMFWNCNSPADLNLEL